MGVSGNVSSVLIHVNVPLTGNTELSHIDAIRRDVCCAGTLRVILRRKETFNLFKLSVLGKLAATGGYNRCNTNVACHEGHVVFLHSCCASPKAKMPQEG